MPGGGLVGEVLSPTQPFPTRPAPIHPAQLTPDDAFGFSFLDQNTDVIRGSMIGGVDSTFENIADNSYPVSRPLFLYAKPQHVASVPGMVEFITELTDERAWGSDGYLADRGLIPMSAAERERYRTEARTLSANLM